MIRATTPTHTFELPFAANQLAKIRISYAQNDAVVFEKTEADCVVEGNSIKVTLTQEETLQFDSTYNVQIQIRALTADGKALASQIEKVRIKDVLNEEVLA